MHSAEVNARNSSRKLNCSEKIEHTNVGNKLRPIQLMGERQDMLREEEETQVIEIEDQHMIRDMGMINLILNFTKPIGLVGVTLFCLMLTSLNNTDYIRTLII